MTKTIKIKNTLIGGGNRVTIQSMTNTPTGDFEKTSCQIKRLIEAGCDIVRLAVCSDEEVSVCKRYIEMFDIPLVADIQFDHKLAIKCSECGFSKVRINPGNIGGEENIKKLVEVCKYNGTPIRVGVNGGSLQRGVGSGAEALYKSAMDNVALFEKFGFNDIVISAKSSDVATMVKANRLIGEKCDYPLHLGVTESGDEVSGLCKSHIGIGALLLDGIGDTIRVSLSGDPVKEVIAARDILRAVGLDKNYCEIISCPTCSRCAYDLEYAVKEVRKLTCHINRPMKIAVMGCVVNGPGEAQDADCGVAGGKDKAVLFEKGKIIKTVPIKDLLDELKQLIIKISHE